MILVILFLVVCAVSAGKHDYRSEYWKAVEKFSNGPTLQSNPASEKAHYKAFVEFSIMTELVNEDHSKTWTAGINFLSIMTPEERHHLYGLNASDIPDEEIERNLQHFESIDDLPLLQGKRRATSADYRSKLPAVKNQGSCGSCWSFGATAALEYQVARLSGKVTAFAEQEYLNCVYENTGRDGCNGGWPTYCYQYNARSHRMALLEDFPYRSYDHQCNMKGVKNGLEGFKVESSARYIRGNKDMLTAVGNAEIGVLSAAIHVTELWGHYEGGLYTDSDCDRTANHAVVVAGYGTQKGHPYWLVRNSWGPDWGEGGYIKMSRRTENLCRLSQYTHYPIVTMEEQKEEEEEEEKQPTCTWTKRKNTELYRAIGEMNMKNKKAKKACESSEYCVGITCAWRRAKRMCGMRGSVLGFTAKKVTSLIKHCD